MIDEPNNRQEQHIRYVAKRYREGSLDTNASWKRFADKQGIRRSVPLKRYLMGAAAVLLAVVGFGSIWMIQQTRPDWVVVTTAAGQVKEVYLPDSTLLTMADHSMIRYDRKQYGKKGRAVEMNGKVFFRVQRNEAHPFSVQTRRTEVVVLGTSFQLTEETDDKTALYVESGKVAFGATEGAPVVLTAGMSAVHTVETDKITVNVVEEPNILAWKTRHLVFRETPLDRVIRDLKDCYHTDIRLNTPPADGLRLTASFEEMPLDDVLLIINQTLDTDLRAVPVK